MLFAAVNQSQVDMTESQLQTHRGAGSEPA